VNSRGVQPGSEECSAPTHNRTQPIAACLWMSVRSRQDSSDGCHVGWNFSKRESSRTAPNLIIDRDLRVFYQVLAEQIRANFSRSEVILI
jgi:hypothetical protein